MATMKAADGAARTMTDNLADQKVHGLGRHRGDDRRNLIDGSDPRRVKTVGAGLRVGAQPSDRLLDRPAGGPDPLDDSPPAIPYRVAATVLWLWLDGRSSQAITEIDSLQPSSMTPVAAGEEYPLISDLARIWHAAMISNGDENALAHRSRG
jgi:hypothetical protein